MKIKRTARNQEASWLPQNKERNIQVMEGKASHEGSVSRNGKSTQGYSRKAKAKNKRELGRDREENKDSVKKGKRGTPRSTAQQRGGKRQKWSSSATIGTLPPLSQNPTNWDRTTNNMNINVLPIYTPAAN